MVTYPCQAHALPFRTILGEYRVRRQDDLAVAVSRHVLLSTAVPPDLNVVWDALEKALLKSEDAYTALTAAKDIVRNIARESSESERAYGERVELGYRQVRLCEAKCERADRPLKHILHTMEGSALCLSGGGIRSASFSLGILQGLARFSQRQGLGARLLNNLDYLSTVSGGGYIGSWMMAWAKRSSFEDVVEQLAQPASTSGDPEPEPIRHLRAYTSYLTPRYGLSLDTLTLAAIVLRNMILNWLIMVPVIVGLMCLPQLLWIASYAWPLTAGQGGGWYQYVMWTSLVFVAVAAAFAGIQTAPRARQARVRKDSEAPLKRPSSRIRKPSPELWLFVVPLFAGSWFLQEVWLRGALHANVNVTFVRLFRWMFPFALIPPLLMALVRLQLLRALSSPFRKHDGTGRVAWARLLWSFIAPVLIAAQAAALLAWCSLFLRNVLFARYDQVIASRGMLVLSIPLIWSVMMVASSFLSGLLSNVETEEEREWWARAGGMLFGYILMWMGLNFVSLFAHEVLKYTYLVYSALGLGAAAGYAGSIAGFSAATANGLKRVKFDQLSKPGKWLSKHRALAPVLSGIALVCITFALADFTTWLRHQVAEYLALHWKTGFPLLAHGSWSAIQINPMLNLGGDFVAALIVLAVAAVLALLGNLFINVNTFSLHGMYRMRLTRAYLGASNFARRPDPFTNFDSDDNVYEQDLPHSLDKRHGSAPLHVIGTALNLVGTRKLAWQQRKAESFTFSPVSCGSWRLGYRPTWQYGGSRGVRLGTAMAISGAAVNPNMGYHSSPLVRILMTLFNTRLGWWLPNPMWPHLQEWDLESRRSRKYLHRNGPKWALMPLLNEAMGRTDDRYGWIELSDGGHFENLGVYEMVMRRCRSIILVDADADGDYQFDDLGNAIRKIQIDLGIPIVFPEYGKAIPMGKGVKGTNLYCLEGVIQYGCVDPGAENGQLLYIKPVLNGGEPPDVRAYHANHGAFPHEPTSNQFFNESQFESYRHLGSWVIEAIMESSHETGRDMDALFRAAKDYRTGPAVDSGSKLAGGETASQFTVKLDASGLDGKPAPEDTSAE